MRLEQLQAALRVAETGSFQEAAQKVGCNQSTISRQVKGLEDELGIALFRRQGRMKLTAAGERLLPRLRRICQEWQTACTEIEELLTGRQTELCMAIADSIGGCYLPAVLNRFQQQWPSIHLRVSTLGSDRALKVLRDGLIDLAIVMDSPTLTTSAGLVVDLLLEEEVQVLLSVDHPLADQKAIAWEQLSHVPQVVFKDGYGMQRLVEQRFRELGLELNSCLELNSLDSFRGVVREGYWLALLPQAALVDARHDPRLVIRPTAEPRLTRRIKLVIPEEQLSLPPVRHFRQLCREAMTAELCDFKTLSQLF
ncbi:LysR family transcriptional regulator [Synechococcus elongatus]|uniref:Probable nitrogen assimilation transcriptional activator n=2 Tax=Synechococcus elongatus TaxID=32046 RepID=NTCB_SYNE7|nr:LysR family transcriptional regulator [Synechococcus elongatus]P52693.1 RecName: Full=Probable nitrogen assimilation transcriptional activator [Synechococcus elongatus PCC 7942 = FACHB-805]ABB57272.1 transcriptional regulator, LysR family [Synechococcus elongatus PCC 7942 = FACHB-805]AJD58214.1 transcriptional regulator [Synechococcus elongatus UTEX 2973]MBD2587678.1 LysR family transcriptional regulator [Synechococcus elongatus FACHB-242]MBD2688543.1 LysR family transcriptional regulator [